MIFILFFYYDKIIIIKGDNMENASNIFVGKFYRITVLSEMLIRMEYSPSGKFLDEATEFARNRAFPVPKISVQQDSK